MNLSGIVLIIITALSGAAGLGYEIVWTRMLALGLGHETPAVLSVLAAFFGGSAVGTAIFDKKISSSDNPVRWYALLEAVVSIWAIVLAVILPFLSSTTAKIIGVNPSSLVQWSASFILPFIYLFPATCAMGGTLIAMEQILSRISGSASVAAAYAANTFGAVAGVITVSFVLLPAAGFFKSLIILGVVSALCSVAILMFKTAKQKITCFLKINTDRSIFIALFLTGLLGIGYEICIVRALSQVLENTVYSFAAVLTVYLFGTSIGAGICQTRRLKINNNYIIAILLLSTTTGAVLLRITPQLFKVLSGAAHGSLTAMVIVEHCIAVIVLIIPTIAMGYSFSCLTSHVRNINGGFGYAMSVNTAGGMVAPVFFGVVLLPVVGLKILLVICSAGYSLLLLVPGLSIVKSGRMRVVVISFISIIAGITGVPSTAFFTSLENGDTVLNINDGVMATCTVIGDKLGGKHLLFNSRFQEGGNASPQADGREAVIPMLLHRDPHKVLFLGVGAGVTFATAGWFKDVQADGVELVPEILPLLKYFIGENLSENCTLITADARRYVAVCNKKYNVIIADLYHPARDGAGYLYTKEHFNSIRKCLTSDGIFCQWIPLYQLDEETMRTILRTFTAVFPNTSLCFVNCSVEMPILGIVGSMESLTIDPQRVEKLKSDTLMKKRLETIRLYSTISLAGGFLGSTKTVMSFTGEGPVNTDDRPILLFEAPHFVYGKIEKTSTKIIEHLLDSFTVNECNFFADSESVTRFEQYRKARNQFIRKGIEVVRSGKAIHEEDFIDFLLSLLKESPDFESAYNPLLGIALQKCNHDKSTGLEMLRVLDTMCGQRSEARFYLKAIEEL